RPFVCHMAIPQHWMIHYLNAGMRNDAAKRAEEARFMANFDSDFGVRHAAAFRTIADRSGLEYLPIDCGDDARWQAFGLRSRNRNDRARDGSARSVSLQAAADGKSLQGLSNHAAERRARRAIKNRPRRYCTAGLTCERDFSCLGWSESRSTSGALYPARRPSP